MRRPEVTPMPPIATGVALSWDADVGDPVAALAAARAEYGDTFVVDSGPDRYLFTFDRVGVASFYRLPEEQASKGVADWRMLRRKMPEEIFDGRRVLPHDLFSRSDVTHYLHNLELALDIELDGLPDRGRLDIFDFTRRLGHRIGMASWGGPAAADLTAFDDLARAFDDLDGAEAFVRPDLMAELLASDKARERDALATITRIVGAGAEGFADEDAHPLFARIVAAWSGEPAEVARVGVGRDVALLHVASMSNLFAALGWALIDLAEHPLEQAAVVAGDTDLAERCALESTRLAQRSLMARYVLTPLEFDVTGASLAVEPHLTIATLLPLMNTSVAPGLDEWNPDRWRRWRLADTSLLVAEELVTAFGHGKHTCPAQPFSLAAMSMTMSALFTNFVVTPTWFERPPPQPAQIGGVARAATPCVATFGRR